MKRGSLKNTETNSATDQRWMMTFADLLSLVLTFFVLLYSMSALEGRKWKEISAALSQKLSPSKIEVEEQKPAADKGVTKIERPQAIELNYLSTVLTDKFYDSKDLKETFSLKKLDDRLIISLSGKTIFKENTTELTENGGIVLFLIGEVLQTIGNHIDIIGTTDVVQKEGEESPTDWNISLNRAVIVSKALRKLGYEYKITSFGRAPIISTGEEENSEVLSRRVNIVIRRHNAEL